MSLLVTGTIGLDDVKTPFGEVKNVYGGSAVYFSFAAKLFTQVRFVGVVGEDFPEEFRQYLEQQDIDLAGLEIRKGSKTFRWSGSYEEATSDAETVGIELNVLEEAGPRVPKQFADTECVFLAATLPELQLDILSQLDGPRLSMVDTRDLWIKTTRDGLLKVFTKVTGAIMNDVEARMLTGENNLAIAGKQILEMGPKFVVIKKGEHGAMLVTPEGLAALPAYPTTEVKDPTGAGDSFAGGMMGYLAKHPQLDMKTLKHALAFGMICASFTIEDFSLGKIETVTLADVDKRLAEYKQMISLD